MTYVSLTIRILLTLAFVAAGGAKIIGVDMMVATFDQVCLGQWLRYLTGIIGLGGALLLWLPGLQAIGAMVLGGTMVGAVLTHLFILGPSAVPAIVLGILCATVLYLHRDQIAALLSRSEPSQA